MVRLKLLAFAPFRMNRLASEMSALLAEDYRSYGIDIPEWRVIATLGNSRLPCSAGYVVKCTRTHKSRISRAVSSLVTRDLVAAFVPGADGREIGLRLTVAGKRMYRSLVPLMLKRETAILACLTPVEQAALSVLLGKLETNLSLVVDHAD